MNLNAPASIMNKHIVCPLLLFTVLAFCTSCSSDLKTVSIAERICLKVPVAVEVTQRSPVEDFIIVLFENDGTLFLSAYVGNAPQFPSADCSTELRNASWGSWDAKEATGKEGTSCLREIQVELSETSGWPRFVHFRLERVSEQQILEAQDIIRSLQLVAL